MGEVLIMIYVANSSNVGPEYDFGLSRMQARKSPDLAAAAVRGALDHRWEQKRVCFVESRAWGAVFGSRIVCKGVTMGLSEGAASRATNLSPSPAELGVAHSVGCAGDRRWLCSGITDIDEKD